MIEFAGLKFSGLTKDTVLERGKHLKQIVTVNAEFIVEAQKNERLKGIISDNYSTFDGQIPYAISRFMHPKSQHEKLSGSDIIYDFCELAKENDYSIFLLGGYEESNYLSVEKLRKQYNIRISGYSPPLRPYPFKDDHNQVILSEIKDFCPDIIFVGFGAVKQEYWIDDNRKELDKLGVKWVVGSGGTFEFVSGAIKRAPILFQKLGLEGIYRIINEPRWFRVKRLIKSLAIFRYAFK